MFSFMQTSWFILPLSIIAGLLIGILIEYILFHRLRHMAQRIQIEGITIFIRSIRGMITVWCGLLVLYISLPRISVPFQMMALLNNFLFIMIVVSSAVFCSRFVIGLIHVYVRQKNVLPSLSVFTNVIRAVISIVSGLIILRYLGISITPLLTAFGIGGLALALAIRPLLDNVFSGLHIAASQKLQPGDYITLESGQRGKIRDITWSNTVIVDDAKRVTIVPNSRLASSIIVNHDLSRKEKGVPIEARVNSTSDLQRVEHITRNVASAISSSYRGNTAVSEPIVRFHTWGSDGVQFTIIIFIPKSIDATVVKHEFLKQLLTRYKKEKIELT
ncbi:MAG TPA: mechanosensitive ion channel family protein [Patescibacteria group bacterium]|nr:mechanosensitive ion channel family protein [Patescibacteria group bacterium]